MENKIEVYINNEKIEISGELAESLQNYKQVCKTLENIEEDKKATNKTKKLIETKFDGLFTDSQKRFNKSNKIEFLDITGKVISEYEVSSKEYEGSKPMDKKGLQSFLAEGLANGWIDIDADSAYNYLVGNQYAPGIELSDLEKKLTALDFTKLVVKSRTIPKLKETNKINMEK